MKFGCCLNMLRSEKDRLGMRYFESLVQAGYEYVELPLAEMMDLTEEEFEKLLIHVEKSNIRCEACNDFFKTNMSLTGPDVDWDGNLVYVKQALHRAAMLGVKRIVFGSGPAKSVPQGFSREKGYDQVVTLLKAINPIAKENDIIIAIEPLRKAECNLINTFQEGCQLARDVDEKNIKVLVDYYHLCEENESVEHVADEGKEFLTHVHFARPKSRRYPKRLDEAPYIEFADALRKAGYNDRISCEAYSDNYQAEALDSLELIKQIFGSR